MPPPLVISIQSDENYYNTVHQINKKKIGYFTDNYKLSLNENGSITGLFNEKSSFDNYEVYNSPVYPTSSTDIDSSGNPRKILSPNIDYFASSSVDSYRNGVEIMKNSHWDAGLVKITAGNPGHLLDTTLFGVGSASIASTDTYYELDIFDPVVFVEKGLGDFIYPIITSDVNQLENYILNGIIEPFPIRSVVSNFSINFPFEPHSTRGQFGNGNINWRSATDSVVSLDYFDSSKENDKFFLDAADILKISTGIGTGSIPLGPPDGYFNTDENSLSSFEDVVYPRGEIPDSSYSSDLLTAVNRMTGSSIAQDTYVSRNQKSFTNGFDCEYSTSGVDSVAFKNLSWNPKNRDNRRVRQDILPLRDSQDFLSDSSPYNDMKIIFFSGSILHTVEYPSMLSTEVTGSLTIDATAKTELFRSDAIRVVRGMNSGLYETPLTDSILSSRRRQGIL